MADQKYIDALLHERAGYARAGRRSKVAQVDVELRRAGYTPARAVVDEAPEATGPTVQPSEPPRKRAPRKRATATQSRSKSKVADGGDS